MLKPPEQSILHVPAREVPVPRHLSPAAQAMLATPWPEDFAAYPALDDHYAWRRYAANADRMLQAIVEPGAEGVGAESANGGKGTRSPTRSSRAAPQTTIGGSIWRYTAAH